MALVFRRSDTGRHSGGLHALLETRLQAPVFAAVGITMILRSAQTFSGGVLSLAAWLGPFFPAFEAITGVGLGAGSEMLGAIAGRTWRRKLREAAEIATRPGMAKTTRHTLIAQAKTEARHAFVFMCVGVAASFYTGLSFLISSAAAEGKPVDGWAAAGDVVVTGLINAVVLFLAVFNEPGAHDAAADLMADIDDSMNSALKAAIARYSSGTSSDADHKFIAEHLPPHKAAKFRRAVAKSLPGRTWKATQIRKALALGNDAGAVRQINRQINTLAKNPENGLERDSDGRTWLVPHWLVMDMWGEEMAKHTVAAEDTARTLTGRLKAKNSGADGSAPVKRRSLSSRDRAAHAALLADIRDSAATAGAGKPSIDGDTSQRDNVTEGKSNAALSPTGAAEDRVPQPA